MALLILSADQSLSDQSLSKELWLQNSCWVALNRAARRSTIPAHSGLAPATLEHPHPLASLMTSLQRLSKILRPLHSTAQHSTAQKRGHPGAVS